MAQKAQGVKGACADLPGWRMVAGMETPPPARPDFARPLGERPAFAQQPTNSGSSAPMVVNICYLLGFLLQPIALVGFILCFALKEGSAERAWANSHLSYHKRTFLIGCGITFAGLVLLFVFAANGETNDGNPATRGEVGVLILFMFLFIVWIALRCIFSLIRASEQAAMPKPSSWLW